MAKKKGLSLEERAQRIVENFGGLAGKEYNQAYAYTLEYLPGLLDEAEEEAKNYGLSVDEYVEASIHNGIEDGDHKSFEGSDLIIQKPDEQEIEEVNQEEVKKALKALLTKENDLLALLYQKHSEYNDKYFDGQLSYPLITIEKLNNRTLGDYTYSGHALKISNAIRLNHNFVALNTEERILETLKHEMIHQWQDEVAYYKPGETARKVKYPIAEKVGKDEYRFTGKWEEVLQKKMPKNRHNKDFKMMASVVGIPAIGDKCYGSPAKMPEPKSYNRKFICGCVASNGYPLTIWSTRKVEATCKICGKDYREVPKGGKVIQVTQSHIEKPGEDAIQQAMRGTYTHFQKFTSRDMKEAFLDELTSQHDTIITELEEGVYQKHHNAYKNGFRYWIAYNTDDIDPGNIPSEEVETVRKERKKAKTAPKKPLNKTAKKGTKKVKKQPNSSVVTKRTGYHYDNPEDLIQLYRELGSMKRVAEALGVTPDTITKQKQKYQIDFGKGTYRHEGTEYAVRGK